MLFRNIISTHGKKSFSIDLMGKAFPILVLLALHSHSPKTDPLFPGVFHISFIQKLHLYLIKRLISKSVRPPQLRIFNNQLTLSLRRKNCFIFLSVRSCYQNPPLVFSRHFSDTVSFKLQSTVIFLMLLSDINTVNPSMRNAAQKNRTENSGIRKMRSPVPAKHVMGLSKMHEPFICIVISDISIFFVGLCNKFQRRMEYYLQSIFPGQKNVLYRIFPYAVHAFRISKMHIIQINVRNGIQSLKSQKYAGKL